MGHIEVNPAKRKSLDPLPIASRQNAFNQQKPTQAPNQIELTSVRLQRPAKCAPPGFHSSALWSVDGIQRIPRYMDRSKSSSSLPEDQPLASPFDDENVAPATALIASISGGSGNQREDCGHACNDVPKEIANIPRSVSAPIPHESSFPSKYECNMLESLQLNEVSLAIRYSHCAQESLTFVLCSLNQLLAARQTRMHTRTHLILRETCGATLPMSWMGVSRLLQRHLRTSALWNLLNQATCITVVNHHSTRRHSSLTTITTCTHVD